MPAAIAPGLSHSQPPRTIGSTSFKTAVDFQQIFGRQEVQALVAELRQIDLVQHALKVFRLRGNLADDRIERGNERLARVALHDDDHVFLLAEFLDVLHASADDTPRADPSNAARLV